MHAVADSAEMTSAAPLSSAPGQSTGATCLREEGADHLTQAHADALSCEPPSTEPVMPSSTSPAVCVLCTAPVQIEGDASMLLVGEVADVADVAGGRVFVVNDVDVEGPARFLAYDATDAAVVWERAVRGRPAGGALVNAAGGNPGSPPTPGVRRVEGASFRGRHQDGSS